MRHLFESGILLKKNIKKMEKTTWVKGTVTRNDNGTCHIEINTKQDLSGNIRISEFNLKGTEKIFKSIVYLTESKEVDLMDGTIDLSKSNNDIPNSIRINGELFLNMDLYK